MWLEATTEAASPSGERQSTSRLCEKNLQIYTLMTRWLLSHEAPEAKGQTREAMSYFYRTFPSNPGNWKNIP